jgi:hypothetical protein
MELAGINYKYLQTKTGKYAAKNKTCLKADLARLMAQLMADPKAKDVRAV